MDRVGATIGLNMEDANGARTAYLAPLPSVSPSLNQLLNTAFDYAAERADTPQLQALVVRSLERKCALLWAQLDALPYCYVGPGLLPPQPGIFQSESS
jgi:hypothetical protein